MQKINRHERHSFEAGKEGFTPETAVNVVHLSKPAPLYVSYDGGVGQLIGYGHEFKFELDDIEGATIWSTVAGVAIIKLRAVYSPQGEVYTNFDKRPQMSALEQSITLALRRLNQQNKALEQKRAEMDRAYLDKTGQEVKNPPSDTDGSTAEPVETETPEETATAETAA